MVSNDQETWKRPWWLAFLDRTNLTVTSLTALYIAYTRSAGAAYFSAGAVMCSLTVKAVKRIIKQPRPAHQFQRRVSYGMPSTHSATITFFGTYIPLACLYLPIHPSLPQSHFTWLVPPLIVVPWASLIAVSRIWLGHHTWQQVAVGCSYGFAFAWLWFTMWTRGLVEYGRIAEKFLDSWIGQDSCIPVVPFNQ